MHCCCCGLCLFMGAVGGRRGPPDMFIVALGSGVAGGPQVQSFTWAVIYSMVSIERGETEGGAEFLFQGQTGGSEFKAAGGLFFNLIFWLLTESCPDIKHPPPVTLLLFLLRKSACFHYYLQSATSTQCYGGPERSIALELKKKKLQKQTKHNGIKHSGSKKRQNLPKHNRTALRYV